MIDASWLVNIHPTPAQQLGELYAEAVREDWARGKVKAAGKSWETHLAKFDGTVLPR